MALDTSFAVDAKFDDNPSRQATKGGEDAAKPLSAEACWQKTDISVASFPNATRFANSLFISPTGGDDDLLSVDSRPVIRFILLIIDPTVELL